MIPYGKQSVDDADIQAVVDVLHSDWLTTGPVVEQFENAFAELTQTAHAVSVCNGTAALHTAMHAAKIQPGDEVIVPAITFVATANAAVYAGAIPIFADVDTETLLICPASVRRKITARTRAIVAVDFAGQPCNYNELRTIADEYGLTLISDACHSLGAKQDGKPVGSLADLNCFSFHPVKPITSGEGGMVTTNSELLAHRARTFRGHGIESSFRERNHQHRHQYDMASLGFNYRLTDLQSALGLSQLNRLGEFTRKRNEIAEYYIENLQTLPNIEPLKKVAGAEHAYHLFVVKICPHSEIDRDQAFEALRKNGVGVNVHYRPVYLNSFYRDQFGYRPGECPQAERAYQQILSLPIYPDLTPKQQSKVIEQLRSLKLLTTQAA